MNLRHPLIVLRLLGLLVGLAACASPATPARWVKEGATDADLEAARAACIAEASRVEEANRRYRVVARGAAFVRCMKARGWEQVADEG